MIAELTHEEIVTNLLSSQEILKRNKDNFYITSPLNLSEYLENIPQEELLEPEKESFSQYAFIKSCHDKWVV